MQLALLNTSILTNYGAFTYRKIDLNDAQILAYNANDPMIGPDDGLLSAIGHESTAQILTELLDVPVAMNRIQFAQEVGQNALVFKLKGRPPEGKILTKEEIETIGYEFGLLSRTA
jgi:Domain of unknown function (DUF1874)